MPTLNWIGKEKVINHHMDVPYKILEHSYGFSNGKQSKNETNSGNKIIHGYNYKYLQKKHSIFIKMIPKGVTLIKL